MADKPVLEGKHTEEELALAAADKRTGDEILADVRKEVDYSTFTMEQLLEAIGKAYGAKDMKLMATLSRLYTKKEATVEQEKKEAIAKVLVAKTDKVKVAFDKLANQLAESGELEGADGFWYAWDFGEKATIQGLTPSSCRITKKTVTKVAGEGKSKGASTSNYVTNPARSEDMLTEVGDHVYLKEATKVTIDKVDHQLHAGTTFNEAWKLSTNGGWRNRVRQALLKESGRI